MGDLRKEGLVGDMTPRLIGEVYRRFATDKSTQKTTYGLFECQYCGKEFEARLSNVKRGGILKVVGVTLEKPKAHMEWVRINFIRLGII